MPPSSFRMPLSSFRMPLSSFQILVSEYDSPVSEYHRDRSFLSSLQCSEGSAFQSLLFLTLLWLHLVQAASLPLPPGSQLQALLRSMCSLTDAKCWREFTPECCWWPRLKRLARKMSAKNNGSELGSVSKVDCAWWCGGVVVWWWGDEVMWWCGDVVMKWCGDMVVWWCGDEVMRWCGDVVMKWCGDVVMGWLGDVVMRWWGDEYPLEFKVPSGIDLGGRYEEIAFIGSENFTYNFWHWCGAQQGHRWQFQRQASVTQSNSLRKKFKFSASQTLKTCTKTSCFWCLGAKITRSCCRMLLARRAARAVSPAPAGCFGTARNQSSAGNYAKDGLRNYPTQF